MRISRWCAVLLVVAWTTSAIARLEYDFNNNDMQTWRNLVVDSASGWTSLEPGVFLMPSSINGGVIFPGGSGNSLFQSTVNSAAPGKTADSYLIVGDLDNGANVKWVRSPAFFLNENATITYEMAWGDGGTATPPTCDGMPKVAIANGWNGVALRDDTTDTFVIMKPGNSTWNAFTTYTISAAELADLDRTHAYTLDAIVTRQGKGGWLALDNVSIDGVQSVPMLTGVVLRETGERRSAPPFVFTVPVGMNLTALTPEFDLADGVTVTPASGEPCDLSQPRSFELADQQGRRQAVIVSVRPTFGYDFNESLSGWCNRVRDERGFWTDLAPNAETVPSSVNGGVLLPKDCADNSLFVSGKLQYPGTGLGTGNYLTLGSLNALDKAMNVKWAHSPAFYACPGQTLDVSFKTAWGQFGSAVKPPPAEDSFPSVGEPLENGWAGLLVRDKGRGAFVCRYSSNTSGSSNWSSGAMQTLNADPSRPYTVDVVDTVGGAKGWIAVDDVVVTGAYPADDFVTRFTFGEWGDQPVSRDITVVVPSAADVTAVAPTFELGDGASVSPASGTVLDFTTQNVYTVTSRYGASLTFAVTAVREEPMQKPRSVTLGVKDGLVLWLKADKGVTHGYADNVVESWRNCIDNRCLRPKSAAKAPVLVPDATERGYPAVRFRNASLVVDFCDNLPTGAQSRTVLMLARYADPANQNHRWGGFCWGGGGGRRCVRLLAGG